MFASCGLFSTLSVDLQKETSAKSCTDYPSLDQIFDNLDSGYQSVSRYVMCNKLFVEIQPQNGNSHSFPSKFKLDNGSSNNNKNFLIQVNTVPEKMKIYKN